MKAREESGCGGQSVCGCCAWWTERFGFYGKDGALTGPDKEHAETSMLALHLHLLQSSLVHINTLPLQQVLAEPMWTKKLSDEDRRGLTALLWSTVNPYGIFRLGMEKRLDLMPAAVPGPRPGGRHPSARRALSVRSLVVRRCYRGRWGGFTGS
ncbi:Tn3 family transposase [Streptomyces sp. NPDC002870]|uniref:Tn3 family transposase n=1 Tax=Streptomyces sp. NPDC002870 TaxID=3364666 RepID=UPI00367D909B